MAVFCDLHPPDLVHFHVVSFGCTSGVVPSDWPAARPKRVAVMKACKAMIRKEKYGKDTFYEAAVVPSELRNALQLILEVQLVWSITLDISNFRYGPSNRLQSDGSSQSHNSLPFRFPKAEAVDN